MERISRKACIEMGSGGSACKAPRTGREIKQHGILHSTTKAIRIGGVVGDACRREDSVAALVEAEAGAMLFKGKVLDIGRRTTEGFLRGRASISDLDGDRGSALELEFQNEFAAASRDGDVIATTPDIMGAMDRDSGEAIGTAMIRYGRRVSVIALPPPDVFLTPGGPGACRTAGLRLRLRLHVGIRRSREMKRIQAKAKPMVRP